MNAYVKAEKMASTYYLEKLEAERLTRIMIERLEKVIKCERIVSSPQTIYCFLYLHTGTSAEESELNVINKLSEELGIKWNRTIMENHLSFSAIHTLPNGYKFHIEVLPNLETDSCRIICKATGRTKKQSKYIEVDVPEIEYYLDCGEMHENA